MSWKSEKHATISCSSLEVEYKILASITYVWFKKLIRDLSIKCHLNDEILCGNNSAIQLTLNPVFHERTKHIDMNVHLVRENVMKRVYD